MGQLVRYCERSHRDLGVLTLEELRVHSPLFEADAVGMTAEAAVAARDAPGATSPSQVQAARSAAMSRLTELSARVRQMRSALPNLDQLIAGPLE